MKKSKWNLIIDAIMLIVMMALIGIGLLNKYILLTGQKKWDKFGNNYEFSWLGLDRQGWNDIHFILGLVLFALLVLHILLHWKMIINIYKSLIKNRGLRIFTAWLILIVSLILALFFFIAKPVIEEPASHFRNRNPEINEQKILNQTNSDTIPGKTHQVEIPAKTEQAEEVHHDHNLDFEVVGSMTLAEVATKYDVPANYIKKELNIPISVSDNEKLGRLRRLYGFTMSRIEEIIALYQKENNMKN